MTVGSRQTSGVSPDQAGSPEPMLGAGSWRSWQLFACIMTGSRSPRRDGSDIMLFDLSKLHGRTRALRATSSRRRSTRRTRNIGSPRRSSSRWTSRRRGRTRFASPGAWSTGWSWSAAGASTRSRCPSTPPFELRYVPRSTNAAGGEREIAEDDLTTAFYREGVAGRHRHAARAVSARAADEAAVQRGVPRAVRRSAGRT